MYKWVTFFRGYFEQKIVSRMSVLIETTLGDIVVDLYINERRTCCLNFLKLCKLKYYNYCLFFSVQRNYVAQTGDPSGTGRGGESVFQKLYGDNASYFDMEMKPRIKHTKRGLVSFVNNGNNQHGSQFFLTLASQLDFLDGKHTIFGEVSEGFEVLDKINEAICDDNDRPYQDIRVNHTIILDDPFDDPGGLVFPDKSPEPTKEQLQSDHIGADEKVNEFEGKNLEEIHEIIEEKDLKIGTQILETIGDIPDADLKPPENVLFICKLNPVTTADDLEIIFSRFGQILSCEIIRDHKTGDSLCYGFIEFAKVEECEKAYLKMENVLIDDRRIHVDFCQSIAKYKWNKSKLQGKYSFASNDDSKQGEEQSYVKRLKIKDKNRKLGEYEMVFEDRKDRSQRHRIFDEKKIKKRRPESSHSDSSVEHSKYKHKEEYSGRVHKARKHDKDETRVRSTEYNRRSYDSYKRDTKDSKRSKDELSRFKYDHHKDVSREETGDSQSRKRKDKVSHRYDRHRTESTNKPSQSKKKKHKIYRKRHSSPSDDSY